jgi:hypothetical protein
MIGIFKKLFKKEKITKKYKNGDTYVGEMKNDKPHGQGTYTWPNGEKYVGVFKNDKKHGHGTWTLKDIKYVGEWKEDKMHGLGTTTSNAIKFIGKFKDNERLQGTHTWISGEFAGDKYVGDFEGDEQHGQGAYTWADGSKYVGEYKDGKMHGQGTYTSNEIKFIGKLKDDEMMQGTHTWISGESAGDKYVGEFKDGEMHGQGTYTWSDGSKYVGEYKDGEQCEGTLTSADGKVEKITKTIKRNELAIFEEFRLKPDDVKNEPPKKKDLLEIDDVYFYYNTRLKKNTYWVLTTPEYSQVDEYRATIDPDHEDYQLSKPKKSSLKKYKTDVKVHIEEYDEEEDTSYLTWWKEDKNGDLVQVNLTEKEDAGVEFKIKSWLRNKAIDAVGLEIRNMKKKAYEYSKDELMGMIEKEENKMIKKGGWKALRIAALSTLGLGWLPFL